MLPRRRDGCEARRLPRLGRSGRTLSGGTSRFMQTLSRGGWSHSHPGRHDQQTNVSEPSTAATDTGRPQVEITISIQTVLPVAGTVAIAWALASIGKRRFS